MGEFKIGEEYKFTCCIQGKCEEKTNDKIKIGGGWYQLKNNHENEYIIVTLYGIAK